MPGDYSDAKKLEKLVYLVDSRKWAALSARAKAMLPVLLRRADAGGRITSGYRSLAPISGQSEEQAEVALRELVESGFIHKASPCEFSLLF